MPSPSLDVAPSWRLTAFPRLHRQDASNPLLQPTFRVTSTRLLRSVVSGDSLPGAVGKPAGVRLRGRSGRGVATLHPGTAPDHLAVIRPPAASCLTARCRLRAVRSPRSCGARVEELGSLVSSRKLRRIDPLTPLAAPGRERKAPDFQSRGPVPAGARQCRRPCPEPRCLPSRRTNMGRPCERSGWSSAPLAGGAFAARVHRCSRTPTRPSFARCSRCA
jgi:hypothetical protein